MNAKTSKTTIMILVVISIATLSANAEPVTPLPTPQKQVASGTAPQDVICNSGLTLMSKLSTSSSACVKPATATKLEELGWGQILKESSMMEKEREKMIGEIAIKNKSIYDPQIIPSNFVSEINNKFLTLTPGTMLVYEGHVEEGIERIEYLVTDEKRKVMGVDTTVVWDREWLNGELIEDTQDWHVQDLEGNVWYFGEDSKEFSGGKLVSTKGSWEAGVDGAKPGIVMMGSPKLGDSYRQEYYAGIAEDMGVIVALDETVQISFGAFSGCLKTKDWAPHEPALIEFKYYCPQIGGMVLEKKVDDQETVELINIIYDQDSAQKTDIIDDSPIEITSEITQEQAMLIAKNAFEGVIGEIGTEYKFGQFAWVVEMQTPEGEIDVVIDKTTGEILGIER